MSKCLGFALGSVVLLSSSFAWAQGPSIKTAPQVVAGEIGSFSFTTKFTFQNRLPGECTAEVLFHKGPGQAVDEQLLVNGQNSPNPFMVTVPFSGTSIVEVTLAGEGLFEGAARITDECGVLEITAGYDISTSGSDGQSSQGVADSTTEVFSYPVTSDRSYTAGNSFLNFAPVDFNPAENLPGVAVVGNPNTSLISELCFDLLDTNGSSIAEATCLPYDGSHTGLTLTEIFPGQQAFQGQWMAWVAGIDQTWVNFLFIDVNLDNNQFRQVPFVGRNAGCLEGLPPAPGMPCLNNDRFSVFVTAGDGPTATGGIVYRIDDRSALFQFPGLGPRNFDLVVQVLDGCSFNGHYWVFASATTDVEFTIKITDFGRGHAVKEYTNTLGAAAPAIADTQAFATCP